jgi:hypothetical protein
MANPEQGTERLSGNASPDDTKQTGRRQQQGGAAGSQHQAPDWGNPGGNQTQDQPDGMSGPDRETRDIIDPDGSQNANRNTDRSDRTR